MDRDQAKEGVPKAHASDPHTQYAVRQIELLGDLIGSVERLADRLDALAGRAALGGDGEDGAAGEPTSEPVLVSEPANPAPRKRAPAKRVRANDGSNS